MCEGLDDREERCSFCNITPHNHVGIWLTTSDRASLCNKCAALAWEMVRSKGEPEWAPTERPT